MKIGLWIPECVRADQIAFFAAEAEHAGYDSVWLPDSQLLWRDVWSTASLVATRTTSARVAIGVTNVETRHPAVIASAIRTIHELTGDRLVVGFGTGGSSVSPLAIDPTTRAQLRARLGIVQSLLRGDDVDLDGGLCRLREPTNCPALYFAANGPRNLRFAPAIADGVITLGGVSPAVFARTRELIEQGTAAAGRHDRIPVVVTAITHITDDVQRDVRLLKPLCAAMTLAGAGEELAAQGITVESLPYQVTRLYPTLAHAEDWQLAVQLAEEYVSDEAALRFAERFCLFGSRAEIRRRVEELAAAGASELVVQGITSYDLPDSLLELCSDLTDLESAEEAVH